VPWDNNLTWRNVNIFDNPAAPGRSVAETAAAFDLVNPYNTAQAVDLLVDKRQWPTGGSVLLTLPGELFAEWVAAGAPGTNIEVLTPTQQVRLTAGAQSALHGLPLYAAASTPLAAAFTGPAGADFMLSFTAQIHGAAIGGVDYRWVVDASPPAVQAAAPAPGSTAVAVDAPLVLTFSGDGAGQSQPHRQPAAGRLAGGLERGGDGGDRHPRRAPQRRSLHGDGTGVRRQRHCAGRALHLVVPHRGARLLAHCRPVRPAWQWCGTR
jgi:hypothetical protein